MEIKVPKEIADFEPELRFFVECMIRKLHLNRHKGFAENLDVKSAFKLLDAEIVELRMAVAHESQFNTYMEAVDVSNQALILGMVTMRLTREEYKKECQS